MARTLCGRSARDDRRVEAEACRPPSEVGVPGLLSLERPARCSSKAANIRDSKFRDEGAAKSAVLDIVEGAGRVTRANKGRAFTIARGEGSRRRCRHRRRPALPSHRRAPLHPSHRPRQVRGAGQVEVRVKEWEREHEHEHNENPAKFPPSGSRTWWCRHLRGGSPTDSQRTWALTCCRRPPRRGRRSSVPGSFERGRALPRGPSHEPRR